MKHSVSAVLALAAAAFTIGCASTETTSNRSATTGDQRIASSEQIDSGLPAVAAPPAGAWGRNSHLF